MFVNDFCSEKLIPENIFKICVNFKGWQFTIGYNVRLTVTCNTHEPGICTKVSINMPCNVR